ncbi:hypothetical protein [Blastopirellula marina]|uniref:Uncharacterized protein n=1 Tax=Blastopirellula marina DSM 3645 TaxID=314230 RepID=A4A0F0_9BACT|nr:hypothetical protein [Blastopirellula marina]EAQ77770.1 hypothetical protein DSM3645_25412 [Blastopirellula marina DSM 3645]
MLAANSRPFSIACGVGILLSILAISTNAKAASSGVTQVLEEGWAIGPDSLATARQAHAAFVGSTADQAALDTAFGLVLIKHHKYEEATALFESLTTSREENQVAWRALIWLEVLQKKPELALMKVDHMTNSIPPDEADDESEEETRATARFLGRIFAYLDGPAEADVSQGVRKLVRRKVDRLMVGARAADFKTNYDEVLREFEKLTDKGDQARDQAVEDQTMAKEQEKQSLADLRKRLEIDQAETQDRLDTLRSELTKELDEFNRMEAPLNDAISRLEVQLSIVRRELLNLTDDLNRLQADYDQTKDPRQRDRLRRDMARTENLLGQYERDNQVILGEGNRLTQRRDALRASRAEMTRRFESEIKETQDLKANLTRRERRTELDEKRIGRPATGNTPQVRVMSAKATSLRTYFDFPLELERYKLLTAGS